MQSTSNIKNVDTNNVTYAPVRNQRLLTDDPQVKQTRKRLIGVIIVCLTLTIIGLARELFKSNYQAYKLDTNPNLYFGLTFIIILLYGFGIFVAYKYSIMGLRVYAGLNIIHLIYTVIATVVGIVMITQVKNDLNHTDGHDHDKTSTSMTSVMSFVVSAIAIGAIISVVISVFIIIFSFKLAKAIQAFNHQTPIEI
ncbi:hypothetical protein I4U23_020333 [Adineta vaga]|nr:hypothetical protein I4U23_020333 [Adineta vaga]